MERVSTTRCTLMATLTSALNRYLENAPDLSPRTRRKLGYLLRSWAKRTANPEIELIDANTFADFRRNCLAAKLSPDTIETSVTDVLTILSFSGLRPEVGRRLRRKTPNPQPPLLRDFGRIYQAAERASRPRLSWAEPASWLKTFLVVAYWTGLRLDDLLNIKRESFTGDGIRRVAEKTKKRHEFPMHAVVKRHLDALPCGRTGRLFDVSVQCQTHVRDWLKAICRIAGVRAITPKQIRQLSVTQWGCASPLAAGIVHGKDLGVLENYLGQRFILEKAASAFCWPNEMLLPEERDKKDHGIKQLMEVAQRLPTKRLADVHRVALAFAD